LKLTYLEACKWIRNDIHTGHFPFGEHLKIADLAERYDTSHMPIREALRLLHGEGLVEIEPNKGVRVKNFDRAFVENIFDVRISIEEMQARRAAVNRTDAQADALHFARKEYEANINVTDRMKLLELNLKFHTIIGEAAKNFEADKIEHRHWQILPVLWNAYGYPQARIPIVINDHKHIEGAILDQDSDGAGILAKAHAYKAKRDILSLIDRNSQEIKPD